MWWNLPYLVCKGQIGIFHRPSDWSSNRNRNGSPYGSGSAGQYGYGRIRKDKTDRIAVCAAVSRSCSSLFVTAYFEIGNVIVAFVGVMGLKVGAYVQPFTHKVILKLLGRGDESS